MSEKGEYIKIRPGTYTVGGYTEKFTSNGHACTRCNGRGHFMPEQVGHDKWEEKQCESCRGSGLLRAVVTVHWSAQTQKKD